MFMAVSITETLLAVLLATYVYSHDCWAFWIGIGPPIPIDGRGFLYDGYAGQEAGLKRRSTISHPRVERQKLIVHTRAPRHCPAPSAAYHAEDYFGFVISSAGCLLSHGHAAFGAD